MSRAGSAHRRTGRRSGHFETVAGTGRSRRQTPGSSVFQRPSAKEAQETRPQSGRRLRQESPASAATAGKDRRNLRGAPCPSSAPIAAAPSTRHASISSTRPRSRAGPSTGSSTYTSASVAAASAAFRAAIRCKPRTLWERPPRNSERTPKQPSWTSTSRPVSLTASWCAARRISLACASAAAVRCTRSSEPPDTAYVIDRTRSGDVAEDILGGDYAGVMIHDGWSHRLHRRRGVAVLAMKTCRVSSRPDDVGAGACPFDAPCPERCHISAPSVHDRAKNKRLPPAQALGCRSG